jgi:acid phosphatase
MCKSPVFRAARCLLLGSLLGAASACAPAPELAEDPGDEMNGSEMNGGEARSRRAGPHENLHSTLYVQTAAEYGALTQQVFRSARQQMQRALEDASWTAFPAQESAAGYRDQPPAVVVDVDETVLDNSPYQARLIADGESYATETWHAWAREERAEGIPGAVRFARAADAAGVTVIYLTNRDAAIEAATRRNLEALGFPFPEDGRDVILTQGEEPGWEEKEPRREAVADDFRILLLLGDNLGDFVAGVDRAPEARRRLAARYADYWGRRWFVLPNPQYGSWEGALYEYDYGLSSEEKLRRKRERLRTERSRDDRPADQ